MLGNDPKKNVDKDPFGFTGGLDAGNGKWKLGARFYDSGSSSFIQQDRYLGDASDPLSLNRYSYCGLDPVNFVDPTGFAKKYSNSTTKNKNGSVTNTFTITDTIILNKKTAQQSNDVQKSFESICNFGMGLTVDYMLAGSGVPDPYPHILGVLSFLTEQVNIFRHAPEHCTYEDGDKLIKTNTITRTTYKDGFATETMKTTVEVRSSTNELKQKTTTYRGFLE